MPFKEPGILAMHKVWGVLPTLASEGVPVDKLAAGLASITLVCACCVTPKFSEQEPPPPGYRSIDDLSLEDFRALSDAINALAAPDRGRWSL